MIWGLAPAVLLFLHLDLIVAGIPGIAEKIVVDVIPSVDPMMITTANTRGRCAIQCAKTKPCKSFAFRSEECILWDAKYIPEDQDLMKKKDGYVYYHYNLVPFPTEIKDIRGGGVSYEEATKICQKFKNGNLVVIQDQKTLNRVAELIKDTAGMFWIGMNGTFNGGRGNSYSLFWADGNAFTFGRFHNFVPVEPNASGKVCVMIARDGFGSGIKNGWADEKCGAPRWPICQYAH